MVARTFPAAVVASAMLLLVVRAEAETEVVPSFSLLSRSEDNARLVEDTSTTDSSSSIVLNADLDVTVFNQRGFLEIQPSLESNAYSDAQNADLEGVDRFLQGRGEYEWQRSRVGFRMDYRREAVIRSELPDFEDPDFDDDIDDPAGGDSGRLVFLDQDRTRLSLRPYVGFEISERSEFRFQADLINVDYSATDSLARTGFDNTDFSASIIRRASERSRVTATLHVGSYESIANVNNTDSVAITGTISRQVSDLWSVNLDAGVGRSDYYYETFSGPVDNASVDYSIGVRARRRSERTQFQVSVGHEQEPSSTGFLVNRNEVRVYLDHDLKPRLSTRFALRASDYSTVGDEAPLNDRQYLRAEFSISWDMTRRWEIRGGYNYTSQDFTREISNQRSSHALFVGIGYQGLSRPGVP